MNNQPTDTGREASAEEYRAAAHHWQKRWAKTEAEREQLEAKLLETKRELFNTRWFLYHLLDR